MKLCSHMRAEVEHPPLRAVLQVGHLPVAADPILMPGSHRWPVGLGEAFDQLVRPAGLLIELPNLEMFLL